MRSVGSRINRVVYVSTSMGKQSDRFDLSPGRGESEWIFVIRRYGSVGAAVSTGGGYPVYLVLSGGESGSGIAPCITERT